MTDTPETQETPEDRAARSWGPERERLLAAMAKAGARRVVRDEMKDEGR